MRSKSGLAKSIALDLITNEGLGTLFINVSFNGLLWGWVNYYSRSSLGVSQPLFTVFSGGESTTIHGLLWGWVNYYSRSSLGVSQPLFTVFSGGESTTFHGLLWGWVNYFSRSSLGVSKLLFTVFSGGESTTFHGLLWGSVNYFSPVFRIQISIGFGRLDPDLGGQKWPELEISFFFQFFEMLDVPFLRAEGFSCLLDVLYGGLGISKF